MFLHMYMHRAWYHTIIAVKCNIIKIHGFAGNIIANSPCDPRGIVIVQQSESSGDASSQISTLET